jgi:hypothetical protein
MKAAFDWWLASTIRLPPKRVRLATMTGLSDHDDRNAQEFLEQHFTWVGGLSMARNHRVSVSWHDIE